MDTLPLAYRRGYQDFYGRNFKVTPDVLIPRPETEQIIDEALNLAGKSYLPGVKPSDRVLPEHPLILDVGTGSGIIAITLKLELPEATVIGLDISSLALKIAQENAAHLNATVDFKISDLLESYRGEKPALIVANLPYVDETWEWLDKEALSAEPRLALFAKDGGLALIKRLLQEIIAHDFHPKILLEMDPCQHETLIQFAKKLGYKHQKTTGYIILLSRD